MHLPEAAILLLGTIAFMSLAHAAVNAFYFVKNKKLAPAKHDDKPALVWPKDKQKILSFFAVRLVISIALIGVMIVFR